MLLLKTWAPYFQGNARQNGRADYQRCAIKRMAPADGELIRAQATDDEGAHTIIFTADGAGTTAACSCPQTGGSYCQHIWATLLAIEHGNGAFGDDAACDQLNNPRPPRAQKRSATRRTQRNSDPPWSTQLDLVRPLGLSADRPQPVIPAHFEVCYVVRPLRSGLSTQLSIELWQRDRVPGGFGRPTRLKINEASVLEIPDPVDRQLCARLLGARPACVDPDELETRSQPPASAVFVLPLAVQRPLLEGMLDTGRCFASAGELRDPAPRPLGWDSAGPWVLWLVGRYQDSDLVVDLELRRGDQRMSIDEPDHLVGGPAGLVFYDHTVAAFEDLGASRWASQFRDGTWSQDNATAITVPQQDLPLFLQRLYLLPSLPRIDLPAGVGRQEVSLTPIPHLDLSEPSPKTDPTTAVPKNRLVGRVWFAYRDQRVNPGQAAWFVTDRSQPSDTADTQTPVDQAGSPPPLIRRDVEYERQATAALWPLGFRRNASTATDAPPLVLPNKLMHRAVNELINLGWTVSKQDQVIRRPDSPVLNVASGIDWFEVRGTIRYHTQTGDQDVALPEILAAARSGRSTVALQDGSEGMLPEDWLTDNALLTAIGQVGQDHVRFKSTQAVILDSLLSRQASVDVDEKFRQIQQRLHAFDGVKAKNPSPTFQGRLRPYQEEGLGWLFYLQTLSIGGILADDMGLGKTVQVLAMLDWLYNHNAQEHPPVPPSTTGRCDGDDHRPSLIVVPRSIVFNWLDEIGRFTPRLRVQSYSGSDRQSLRDTFNDHDVIVTSYGVMRRDIAELTKCRFRFVVLDEAQTIKNAGSQSAKSARLIDCHHRIALTGTPVENHLGDLWSILEFLNPGMLGSNTRFARLVREASQQDRTRGALAGGGVLTEPKTPNSDATAALGAERIAAVLKPFILRRAKHQVLKDLPEKTEQTILCEMEPHQRSVYDQLLGHYRSKLLGRRGGGGPLGSDKTMMVLEALLRLRQAACHVGLIDPARGDEPSAKLDVLMDRIQDLIDEGHKALVFSQFTSLLALVRKQLDAKGIVYEYLDGKTRNRADPIDRFQKDPHCPLFLISLKAGGLGLNLTAAEYVFILDPWWNPAVESQAIDRAHRIGQTRHVFAYRLICQDTVEQRIAQLQDRKRRLADAIIGGQENVLRSLSREDLQYLLT